MIFTFVKNVDLLRQFIVEAVIDASGTFAARRAQIEREKIGRLSQDMPNVFNRQEDQEKRINARLESIHDVLSRFVSTKRARLMMPKAFSDDEWGPSAKLFDVIETAVNSEYEVEAKNYVMQNRSAFTDAVKVMDEEVNKIVSDADALEWPAPWRRYTNYNLTITSLNRFKDALRRLMK